MRSSSRGFTLVEMLVVAAGLLLVGYLSLEIYDQTQQSSKRIMTKQTVERWATTQLGMLRTHLFEAESSNLPGIPPAEFKPDHLVVTQMRPTGRISIRFPTNPKPDPVPGEYGTVELKLRYATEARPTEVKYRDELTTGEFPQLVELTLNIKLKDLKEEPLTYRSTFRFGAMVRSEDSGTTTTQVKP